MKEELISLRTAKLAKEKGFSLFSTWYYYPEAFNKNGEPRLIADGILNPNKTFYDNVIDNYECGLRMFNHNEVEGFYSTPTQSLLQKWLREIHNIDVFVDSIGSGKYFYTIYVNDESDTKIVQDDEYKFEVALEEGLFQALKLIKI